MPKTRLPSNAGLRAVHPPSAAPRSECDAQDLLRQWIADHVLGNMSRAARMLDCSWAYLVRILDGRSRPGIDFVLRANAVAGVAVHAWQLRSFDRAVGAS